MSRRKLPPRLYWMERRGKWVIRFDGWMRTTPFGLADKDAAQAVLDKILGEKSWAHAVRKLIPAPRKLAEPPWARSSMSGVIYFISTESPFYPIKIGFCAGAMDKRLGELQIGNPDKLAILAMADGTYGDEQTIHRLLKDYRLVGEWFDRLSPVREALQCAKSGQLSQWIARSVPVLFCTTARS